MHEPDGDFEPKEGDLFFQDLVGIGASDIESVTPGFMGAEVSHMGMLIKVGSRNYIIEAFPPEVRLTPLVVFLRRAKDFLDRPRVFNGRLKTAHRLLIPRAKEKTLGLRGLPYDRVYLTGEDAYFCSELVVDAFKYANGGREFFPEHPMSFRDKITGEILEYWKNYYSYFGLEVPQGEPGSNPGKIGICPRTFSRILGPGKVTRFLLSRVRTPSRSPRSTRISLVPSKGRGIFAPSTRTPCVNCPNEG